jgi:hypothetical protein
MGILHHAPRSLAVPIGVLLLAAAALLPSARWLEATPAWDASRGTYVSGCDNHLSIWRMQGGVPVECTRYELERPKEIVPAEYSTVERQVEVQPGVFETQTEQVLVTPERRVEDWSRAWISVIRLRLGPAPSAAPVPARPAACGAGGKACGK